MYSAYQFNVKYMTKKPACKVMKTSLIIALYYSSATKKIYVAPIFFGPSYRRAMESKKPYEFIAKSN